MAPRRGKPKSAPPAKPTPKIPDAPFEVQFSHHASEVYKTLHQKMAVAESRGDTASSHHTVFRMIEDAIKNFIPMHAVDKAYGLAGPLSKYFRVKKGRYRICWAASSEKRGVCILFISETLRKAGDSHDPYVIFERLVKSGGFDVVLQRLGIKT